MPAGDASARETSKSLVAADGDTGRGRPDVDRKAADERTQLQSAGNVFCRLKFNPSRSPTATVFASAWYERSACRLQHSGKVRAQMFAHRRHVRSLVAGQVRCRRPGCREIKLSRRVSSRPSSGESPLRQRAVEQLRFCAPWKAR